MAGHQNVGGTEPGIPLSAIFAELVLDKILRPLDASLRAIDQSILFSEDIGDDGHGLITHFFGWVDG